MKTLALLVVTIYLSSAAARAELWPSLKDYVERCTLIILCDTEIKNEKPLYKVIETWKGKYDSQDFIKQQQEDAAGPGYLPRGIGLHSGRKSHAGQKVVFFFTADPEKRLYDRSSTSFDVRDGVLTYAEGTYPGKSQAYSVDAFKEEIEKIVAAQVKLEKLFAADSKPGAERDMADVKLCWCPAGKFTMGSPATEAERRDDEKQVEVRLTHGFWIGKYEVTQGQWKKLVGEFPDQKPTEQWGQGDDYPLYWVNYAEAETFCQRLTWTAHDKGELPSGWEFRLPTEAQWEYACRAGTNKATSFGDTLSSKQANLDGTKPYNGAEQGPKLGGSSKVGSYPANAWNIHDMHGNVFEWTRDWYHAALPGGDDPEATTKGSPNRDGTYSRVRRGGAWCEEGKFCRAAFRLRYEPDRRSDHIGFRVVAVEVKK